MNKNHIWNLGFRSTKRKTTKKRDASARAISNYGVLVDGGVILEASDYGGVWFEDGVNLSVGELGGGKFSGGFVLVTRVLLDSGVRGLDGKKTSKVDGWDFYSWLIGGGLI